MELTETGTRATFFYLHFSTVPLYFSFSNDKAEFPLNEVSQTFTVLMADILYFAVSVSETLPYASYILYGTVPALLLLLIAAAGFFCYKHHAKRWEERRCRPVRPLGSFRQLRSSGELFILPSFCDLSGWPSPWRLFFSPRVIQEKDADPCQQVKTTDGRVGVAVRRARTLRL